MATLSSAIETLYETFSVYPSNPGMESCPCCVSSDDRHALRGPLRALRSDQVSRYAFKAMTTWGDAADFKHYLPRIFELLAKNDLETDDFVVFGKLAHASWTDWPANEQQDIHEFLIAAWCEKLSQSSHAISSLAEIHPLTGKMDLLLSCWKIDIEGKGFETFVHFILDELHLLKAGKGEFKDFSATDQAKLSDWIAGQKSTLETGFFHYETKNATFSKLISDALFVLESYESQSR